MRPITLVLPFYENPSMMAEQTRYWKALPAALSGRLHVIVVDDGSPSLPADPHALDDTGLAPCRLYRNHVDIRWNWLFCRNLGVQEATTEWVLMTDMDHVLPASTLEFLLTAPLLETAVYRFARVDAPHLTPYKPHPNSWCLTKALYDRIGGYDERFSGFYGTDADFRDRVHQTASAVILLEQPLIRYPREVIPDASTTTYLRKQPEDHAGVTRIRAERELVPNWRPLRVQCPWTRLR